MLRANDHWVFNICLFPRDGSLLSWELSHCSLCVLLNVNSIEYIYECAWTKFQYALVSGATQSLKLEGWWKQTFVLPVSDHLCFHLAHSPVSNQLAPDYSKGLKDIEAVVFLKLRDNREGDKCTEAHAWVSLGWEDSLLRVTSVPVLQIDEGWLYWKVNRTFSVCHWTTVFQVFFCNSKKCSPVFSKLYSMHKFLLKNPSSVVGHSRSCPLELTEKWPY